ncbi:MAG: bifunctional [glutamate--ammonia ligase]-adenylyl-L-tyrosine phosphorylase/[glutamate--ammonia-ligase] adenylyltransferase [Polyangia bacterium]
MATLAEYIASGPDPEAAGLRLQRLHETGIPLPSDGTNAILLAALLASGDFLPDLVLSDPGRLPALLADPWLTRPKPRQTFALELRATCASQRGFEDLQRGLRRYVNREMLRLGAREIGAGIDAHAFMRPEHGLTIEVAHELSALADACLGEAVRFCQAEIQSGYGEPVCNDAAPGFSVLAMGKLGGEELNFSSDIDLIYIYSTDDGHAGSLSLHEYYARLCQRLTRLISEPTGDGIVFRVDLGLRPEGRSGAICNSLGAAESYYETFGRTWERQALLRARHSAGDTWLGERFLKTVEPFVYRRASDEKTMDDVRSLRRMFVDRVAGTTWNVKLSSGGIRDVELVAQALQLLYGGKRRDLRERATLPALHKLGLAGLLSGQEVHALSEAYRLLRRIEHRLQLERGQQTHLLPADGAEVARLARRLGFGGADEFSSEVTHARRAVSAVADSLGEPTSGPSPLALRLLAPTTGKDEIEHDLRAAGFCDLERSAYNLETARARLPAAWLEEAIASPDPDRSLASMRDLALKSSLGLFALLEGERQLLRVLAGLFGTSERLSCYLITHPEIWPRLTEEMGTPLPDPQSWRVRLAHRLAGADYETALRIMRKFQAEEVLRIGLHDVAGNLSYEQVSAQLSDLAELMVGEATRRVADYMTGRYGRPTAELTILVLGSCGAREMRYGSDLELVFLYENDGVTDKGVDHQEWFARLAQRLLSALGDLLEEGRLYIVDTRLRPSGSQGLLVTSYRAFAEYHATAAASWERVALLRGRPACLLPGRGDAAPSEFTHRLTSIAYQHDLSDEVLRNDIVRMRMRIERERAGKGGLHLRFSAGGLTDLDFLAAWAQLRRGREDAHMRTTNPLQALMRMVELGQLDPHCLEDYRWLARATLRLRLLRNTADDCLRHEDELPLARSLGYTPSRLVAELSRRMANLRALFREQLG